MKKVLRVTIILAMVLGTYGPSFGNDEVKAVGRFHAVKLSERGLFFLVDTVTGQTWMLEVNKSKLWRWIPVFFENGSMLPPKAEDIPVKK